MQPSHIIWQAADCTSSWVTQVPDALHMHFTDKWFIENVIDSYLRGRKD